MNYAESPTLDTRSRRALATRALRKARDGFVRPVVRCAMRPIRPILNHYRFRGRIGSVDRKLEIGPGEMRLTGFETLDIVGRPSVDYVADAGARLPFPNSAFSLVYASHVLEHIPWYRSQDTVREWVRILQPHGVLEVWVPDALKICKALADFELSGVNEIARDGWYRFNDERDPCKWAAGRLFTYGDGTGRTDHPNWHRACFTPRYLVALFERVGLTSVEIMDPSQVRGHDHGWINLGVRGVRS